MKHIELIVVSLSDRVEIYYISLKNLKCPMPFFFAAGPWAGTDRGDCPCSNTLCPFLQLSWHPSLFLFPFIYTPRTVSLCLLHNRSCNLLDFCHTPSTVLEVYVHCLISFSEHHREVRVVMMPTLQVRKLERVEQLT